MQSAEVQDRFSKMAKTRSLVQLVECPICLDGEVLVEELVFCDNRVDQHGFCPNCVKHHVQTQIANGAHNVSCIWKECDTGHFSTKVLETVVEERQLQILANRLQQQELRMANIPNLCKCPFCDFAMIMEEEQCDFVFRCLHPECGRESYRDCGEANHAPLSCGAERSDETRIRTFVENEMAEALIRKCPKCQKPGVKQSGCNHISCACGMQYCYVCRKEMLNGHFSNGKCDQNLSDEFVHTLVAKKAGEAAKEKFKMDNPNLTVRPDLEVDVTKLI